jgi:hypothetical protein
MPAAPQQTREPVVTVGLVNNMPDTALQSTERQFLELIDAAAGGMAVRLRLFSLPGCRAPTPRVPICAVPIWTSPGSPRPT